ncbi:MAG: hypothetical protein ACRDHD_08810, partial [Candidatus Limnocylindria bacterium]
MARNPAHTPAKPDQAAPDNAAAGQQARGDGHGTNGTDAPGNGHATNGNGHGTNGHATNGHGNGTKSKGTGYRQLAPGEQRTWKGLSIERRFTTPGTHPYDTVEWDLREAAITNEHGKVVFEQKDLE